MAHMDMAVNDSFFSSFPAQQPVKVLVVDSDPWWVQTLASALREAGYLALEATSFAAGKYLWSSENPQVLIADIRLGAFNGLQLLFRGRADRPDLRAVITCPCPDVVLEAETRRFGGTFMVKPVEPDQILAAIGPVRRANAAFASAWAPPFIERRTPESRHVIPVNAAPERGFAERRAR